ncbi:MAG: glucose 1-dehydrogenase [Myxococcaceae bacterium]|nr:glucose 1-dehydrogenase [Myxococcaceae bacterium]
MSQGPFRLEPRVAIVTGAAMGIGFGIARAFVDAGARVLMADLDADALRAAAARLPKEQVGTVVVDVATDGCGEQLVSACLDRFGRLDVLVNNAGIYPQKPMLEMPMAMFDRVWRVNVRGLVDASCAAGRQFIKAGRGGSIINISSIDSLHPSMVGLAAYDCTKGAVNMFTRSLALELALHRVRVNAIAPGGITTEGTKRPFARSGMSPEQMERVMADFARKVPLGRMGVPEDIAWPAVFLASDAAAYITGAVLVVDGGVLLS